MGSPYSTVFTGKEEEIDHQVRKTTIETSVVRVGGFVAIIVGLWVIVTGVDLITSVLLAFAIAVMVVLFVFNRSPAR